ncbi:ArgK protein [Gaertneriomyces semiglobifer]|nr:ArgK protein [Gaertneriomyces semiglobifer]
MSRLMKSAHVWGRRSWFLPLPHQQQVRTLTVSAEPSPRVLQLYDGLVNGQRAALAKAITLVESTHPKHKHEAQDLLALVLSSAKRPSTVKKTMMACANEKFPTTFRIGLSGSPGVGKSSFIEAFGLHLISKGHRVAVLAVDPSSSKTGGSILGDKTRMPDLSRHSDAFIRPSPSSCTLGGVARNTNEAILLCESAGYDIVLVETVGVGQSETMVADMVDMFTLLVAPGGGDELQGMKKGIVELSNLILVNKSDGDLLPAARQAQMEYTSALKFMPPEYGWHPPVLPVSSHKGTGIDKAWDSMKQFYCLLANGGRLSEIRGRQQLKWMWKHVTEELVEMVKRDKKVMKLVEDLQGCVYDGGIPSGIAAEKILDEFMSQRSTSSSRSSLS